MNKAEELALAIADRAARSDIEIYAMEIVDQRAPTSLPLYNISFTKDSDSPEARLIVNQALEYLYLRREALPYSFNRIGNVIWFVEKESTK